MKFRFSWPALLLLVITLASCSKEYPCVRGSSHLSNQSFNLSHFEGVDYRLPGKVQVVKGAQPSITIQASDNHLGIIRAQVRGNHLVIDTDNRCLKNTSIDITVTTPTLNYLRVAGSGYMVTSGDFTSDEWTLRVDGSGDITASIAGEEANAHISGSGTIQLQGAVNSFNPTISGSGDIKAYSLAAKNVEARISGSGKIQTTVTDLLKVSISGSGDVFYKGSPSSVNSTISGSGRLVKGD
ncbi:MAG: head GIN domain-containing protein [Chitinophagaceae bacterium]